MCWRESVREKERLCQHARKSVFVCVCGPV